MSASAVSAGLFVGGVAVGATGAWLLQKPEHNKPIVGVAQASIPNHSTSTPSPSSESDIRLIHGNPGPVADFLRHVSYISAYDRMHKHPHWTAEHITAAHLRPPLSDGGGGKGDRSRSVFKEDDRIPLLFRSKNSDYFRSGYDRGHMVPAADSKISQIAMDETFLLSNIAPQIGEGFNRDYWAHLEDYVRRLTTKFENLYVFTIPLYLPRLQSDGKWRVNYEVIGDPPSVSVPTHFAKVIYAQGRPGDRSTPTTSTSPALPATNPGSNNSLLGKVGLSGSSSNWTALGAFVLPNAIIPNEQPLKSFLVPVEAVERAAGLMLFPPATKTNTPSLCDVTDCQIIVRDFSDRNKQQQQQQQTRNASLPTPSR
ncbi:uncharacterized protein FA14DRAFT_162823 [Meira miltonrushii]|uniref:Endonuclease n=1 Tax=Meira miltonrushii TaxID=1280837 RepID=A0A316V163_9BASI|nr:uncharacterized protein FA14DRAFT_162823 [Meira miltonrushii]PWN31289.1 hypothetical protein FA14DRAFT_162823 [Meira miltonrushii]